MPEITLADLMNSGITDNAAPVSVSAEELSKKIAVLSPEDRALADEIKSQIDVRDSQMLMQYGAGAKQDIAEFSNISWAASAQRTPDMQAGSWQIL